MTNLKVGDRVRLTGGYEPEPKWLCGQDFYEGEVITFLSIKEETPLAVVRLDKPISFNKITGDILVLKLRYVDASWHETAIVQAYLYDFVPKDPVFLHCDSPNYIESHVSYDVIP